jgi:hypothetical protein
VPVRGPESVTKAPQLGVERKFGTTAWVSMEIHIDKTPG